MTPEERRELRAARMRAFHEANPEKLLQRNKAINRLTDVAIRAKLAEAIRTERRLVVPDGGGLFLQISPKGSGYWVFKYRLSGEAKSIGLGPYPTLSLAGRKLPSGEYQDGARDLADRLRYEIKVGKTDPTPLRKAPAAEPSAPAKVITFRDEALDYLKRRSGGMTAKYEADMRSRLKRYAFPVIGDMDIRTIKVDDVLKVIEPVWDRRVGAEVHLNILEVMRAAIAGGHRDGSNPADLQSLYHRGLPKAVDVRQKTAQPSLPYQQMKPFMAALRAVDTMPAKALEFTILTAARAGEVLGATWAEIDIEAKLWTVPAARMKGSKARKATGDPHRVPLSAAAVALLESLPGPRDAGAYVFPGAHRGQKLDREAMRERALHLLTEGKPEWCDAKTGERASVHGFRSSFRDWCQVVERVPHDVSEAALNHQEQSRVVRAYARDDLLELRRPVMQAWSDFVAKAA